MSICPPATRGNTISLQLGDALGWPEAGSDIAIVLFVRGPWCPVCRRQIARYAAMADEFAALGGTIYIVSTDTKNGFKSDPQLGSLPVKYIADSGGALAVRLEIDGDHPDYGIIARPTTLVVDRTGHIHYGHTGLHPRDRPEPAAILLAVRRMSSQ